MEELYNIGAELLAPYTKAKDKHLFRCLLCKHEWDATPLSIKQTYKKYKVNGCPACAEARSDLRKVEARCANIARVKAKGLHIISDWTGQVGIGKASNHVYVKLYNPMCGHTFETSAKNLLTRNQTCTVCGKLERTANINHWSELNSAKWKRTAPEWKVYRSNVTKHTRVTYKANKHIVNPHNLPTGRAGTPGAYHLDHIVPVRWCFERNVPPEIVANVTNLQMLPWLDNVASRDHIKGELPAIFLPYADK